jgi:hypothetical protein
MEPPESKEDDTTVIRVRAQMEQRLVVIENSVTVIDWASLEEYIHQHYNSQESLKGLDRPTMSMEAIVSLADQCEAVLFESSNQDELVFPGPVHGLLAMVEKYYADENTNYIEQKTINLIATAIAMNMIESSVRHLTMKEHGHAPLLKDMVGMLSESEDRVHRLLSQILSSLLLPNDGLNLRNLIWHGFVPIIDRRWLALSIVLVLSMDNISQSSPSGLDDGDNNNIMKCMQYMREHESLSKILDHGQSIRSSNIKIIQLQEKMISSDFIPQSHKVLCRLALKYEHYPVIFASIVGPLIENSLRILWCEVNNRNQTVAKSGSYYVTLDGHGQRDKHDVLLLPFISNGDDNEDTEQLELRNALVYKLGGSLMALLVDLFASPPGAPNIRACVAHGMYNKYLYDELQALEKVTTGQEINTAKPSPLEDMSNALISLLDILSDASYQKSGNGILHPLIQSYRPLYSYSALLLRQVQRVVQVIESFSRLLSEDRHTKFINTNPSVIQQQISDILPNYRTSFSYMKDIEQEIHTSFHFHESSIWTVENTFQECRNNQIASKCGAAALLLSEIAQATEASRQELGSAIHELECSQEFPNLSSRRRKQISRLCSVAQITLDFYAFAALCGLLFIERQTSQTTSLDLWQDDQRRHNNLSNDTLFLAVKRSRMVVSTFSTAKMLDRGLAAVQQYSVGKAVKAIRDELYVNNNVMR